MGKPLERISDDELGARLNAIKAMIRRSKKHESNDTRDAEIELCYLQREQEVRDLRRQKHQEYVENLKREAREEEEALNEFLNDEPESTRRHIR